MTRPRIILSFTAILLLLGGALAYEIVSTRPVREALRAYSELVVLGNRVDLSDESRIAAARVRCSARLLAARGLSLAPEGGIAGLPRTIDKNFQAWCEGPNVWIAPKSPRTRSGPVYQFVKEAGRWRFDGLVAIRGPQGDIIKTSEMPDLGLP
jgi:hypothetical protein